MGKQKINIKKRLKDLEEYVKRNKKFESMLTILYNSGLVNSPEKVIFNK